MRTSFLDTSAWKSGIILAQDDHAAFARNVALHETLQLRNQSMRLPKIPLGGGKNLTL